MVRNDNQVKCYKNGARWKITGNVFWTLANAYSIKHLSRTRKKVGYQVFKKNSPKINDIKYSFNKPTINLQLNILFTHYNIYRLKSITVNLRYNVFWYIVTKLFDIVDLLVDSNFYPIKKKFHNFLSSIFFFDIL